MMNSHINSNSQAEKRCFYPQLGFGLIEMMIVVTIIGITTAMSIPAFNAWIADSKTRTMAEVLQNGLREAQTEALQRGRQVQFFLTTDSPSLTATESSSGKNWGIRTMQLTDKTKVDEYLKGVTMAGSNPFITVNAPNPTVQFNSIGRLSSPAQTVTIQLTNSRSNSRRLNITVSLAGAVRMCDPDKVRGASTPDGC